VAKSISRARTIDETLQEIMRHIGEIFAPLNWSILLKSPQTGNLTFALVVGQNASKLRSLQLPKGEDGRNLAQGREILQGRKTQSHWKKRFLLSALQSEMFNAYLVERIQRGWFARILTGDIAKKTDTGGIFLVEDEAVEQTRMSSGHITHTGPIYGTKMRWAEESPGQLEHEIFERFEVTPELLRKARLEGSRRPGRLIIDNISIAPHDRGLMIQFSLPKGSYATVLMREFMKTGESAGI
ncbi:MAG: tRNA pseudouridine(13) synthase TruD, partial [Deltaproteobacteria bacterium]|nr:tRNA pseudouridine(13) synthase TruD [Deltaproteobacteria bacterium]